ncbi:hypothetical protein OOT46_20805 [Aquabacterium sp. A7-Y]|uniref:hypothetical protein n=1 Tax=Aquabacterium sp. A7-Y TaxID=1349605 RepID=UPI00223DC12B|nr:hypothetical protein [Aquabacterium sp. A7-Y]MCW7540278.1 hypothetical protein [Aquabacterium sp. A7-Y]
MQASQGGTPATGDYPIVYRNLMAVALLGAVYKARDDAETVSAAVERTLDDPLQFRLYRAIAQGIGGDSEFASSTLGHHLEQHPEDDGAKVALAVSMMLAGNPDWKQWIDNVLATSSDQTAREAANGVIGYLRALKLH